MSGVGRVYLRGGWYWIAYFRHGREIRESTKTRSESAAKRLLADRLKATALPHEERLRFEDLIQAVVDDYTVNRRRTLYDLERSRIPHLRKAFAGMRAVDITGQRLRAYVASRIRADAAPATINRELGVIRRGFRLLVQGGALSRAPYIALLKETTVRQGFVVKPDFEAIVAALPAHMQSPARFLYLTGWRLDQALSLEWRDVDLEGGEVRARAEHVKGEKPHAIPLGAQLRTVLEQASATRRLDCPFVFHLNGRRQRRESYSRRWKRTLGRLKLGAITVHDLRRSATRNMVMAGVPETVVMAMTGHRTRSMFDRYAIKSREQLLDAQARLGDYMRDQSTAAKVRKIR